MRLEREIKFTTTPSTSRMSEGEGVWIENDLGVKLLEGTITEADCATPPACGDDRARGKKVPPPYCIRR